MTVLFPKVGSLKLGYHPTQVEEFFDKARSAYERTGTEQTSLEPLEVRRTAFDLKHGGYETGAVDAALDRLETAFVGRQRETYVRANGQDAWMQELATRAQTLYPRLRRPAGERFSHPSIMATGYRASDVDELLARVTAFFDRGAPLTADDVRGATFRTSRGSRAYDEATVDAFLARMVDILLGVTEG
ncbi:DivIVA domain-containing protein [Demequina mangrovi]|uniref:DivIVA domain-containing protein n=1 Tax=Demequina mangrovi TaxID=1043493 RepID=A0A1H6Z6Q1_9MICO|nr:DivIVA domain-containing protein [Demequina mangrovi]SEJ49139.1 DivIVA domain-containing protein [Demequina mangrovi]